MIQRTLFAILAYAFLLLTLPVTTASAHTHFFMSEPAPDEVLSSAPQQIRLWFSSPVESDFSRIEVTNDSGKRIDKDNIARDSKNPKILEVELPELRPGQYHVDWNVVSGDGHRVKGNFSFTVK